MNGRLAQAIELAEERKSAALGEGDFQSCVSLTTEDHARAILSGFDIDFEEFQEIAARAGYFFARSSFQLPLPISHLAAWTDGLIAGLFFSLLPPTDSDTSDTEVTGTEF